MSNDKTIPEALDDADLDDAQGGGIVLQNATVGSIRTEQLNNKYPDTATLDTTALSNPTDGLAEYDESGPGIVHSDRLRRG